MSTHVPLPDALRVFTDPSAPLTAALQNAMPRIRDRSAQADLLFLERREIAPQSGISSSLRVQQIRRANPELANAIRTEVAGLRPRAPRVR
jgi:hypothetical protein